MPLPDRPVIGILHPGAMGAAVAAALRPVATVLWAAAGRSNATARRAADAGAEAVTDVADLARRADVVVAVCPPDAALDVAREVAAALDGRPGRPLYVDANAVAPATVRAVGDLLGEDTVVDGAVVGPPPRGPGTTTLWLSGRRADEVAALFAGSPFDAPVLGPDLGAASALKACYALHTKGVTALWLALGQAARAYGVEDALGEQMRRHAVDLPARLADAERSAAGKAWRWAGEMDEAAAAFAAVGVPDGFSRAAGEVYRRLPRA